MNKTAHYSVLIVDDQPENIQIAASILKAPDLVISYATDAEEALDRLSTMDFDLFLLDIMMPGIDGLELCSRIKKMPQYKQVPVIFLTAKTDKQTLIDGFRHGAVDYIAKPFFAEELVHRVRAHLQLRDAQRRMEDYTNELNLQILKAMKAEEELQQKQNELSKANKALSELASTDPLTKLLNRRKGWDYLEYEEERSQRHSQPIGTILLDLDNFKSVNDSFGHEAGDRVLVKAAETMRGSIRKQDILIRWGGEEFLICLPETDLDGSITTIEKIRTAMSEIDWQLPDQRSISFSFGVTVKSPEEKWDTAINRADKALYKAKDKGRNRWEAAPENKFTE
ncbi:GGDEF domain-containing response regulator [Spirochaeta dissipatitropha]